MTGIRSLVNGIRGIGYGVRRGAISEVAAYRTPVPIDFLGGIPANAAFSRASTKYSTDPLTGNPRVLPAELPDYNMRLIDHADGQDYGFNVLGYEYVADDGSGNELPWPFKLQLDDAFTNLLINPVTLLTNYLTPTGTLTRNATTDVTGGNNGHHYLSATIDGDLSLQQSVTLSPSTVTLSVWVKAAAGSEGNDFKLTIKRAGGTFVLESMTHVMTSEWVRVDVTLVMFPDNTGVQCSFSSDVGSEFYVCFPQLETGTEVSNFSDSTTLKDELSVDLTAYTDAQRGLAKIKYYDGSANLVVADIFTTYPGTTIPEVSYNDTTKVLAFNTPLSLAAQNPVVLL